MGLTLCPTDHYQRFAKVCLSVYQRMGQRHKHPSRCQTTVPNVILDDSNLAAERLLVSQPVLDPLCRVTLLLRDLQVVLEDLIDDALEWV